MFLFYLEIVNKLRQVSIWISQFTHSIKQTCGRCGIKFIWQFTALSVQILLNLYWKLWKTVVQAFKLLKSICEKLWGRWKGILSIYYFSLPDEGDDNNIYQFLSFSVYFGKFWVRQGGLSFYGSHERDKGADTDLTTVSVLLALRIKILSASNTTIIVLKGLKHSDLIY